MQVPERLRVPRLLPEHFVPNSLGAAIFGPGEGEAIVVRLPDKGLGVVDGCREPKSGGMRGQGDPVRELLAQFADYDKIEVEDQRLEFVCLTHPHEDHYRGIGRLLDAYFKRVNRLWMPPDSPRYMNDFSSYFASVRGGAARLPDVSESKGLRRVIVEQNRFIDNMPQDYLNGIRELVNATVDSRHLRISMCSPPDADVLLANRSLTEALDAVCEGQRGNHVYEEPDPNAVSGSMLIRWGRAALLLAGDLLRETSPYQGWAGASREITGKVQVVNVAHHASIGAHDQQLWKRIQPKLAIVTPFKQAKKNQPPRPNMIRRLIDSGATVAITTPPSWPDNDLQRFKWNPPLSDSAHTSVPVRNPAISATRVPGHDARNNAVAVSLMSDGSIARIVLAGEARIVSHE